MEIILIIIIVLILVGFLTSNQKNVSNETEIEEASNKEFKLFLKGYLSKEYHIKVCYDHIIDSGCVDGLKLDFGLFSKHFKAIQVQMLLACIERHTTEENYQNFYKDINEVVNRVDVDIWTLVKKTYEKSYASKGIRGMANSLNEKPFKGSFDNNLKSYLVSEMDIMEEQFDTIIKVYL